MRAALGRWVVGPAVVVALALGSLVYAAGPAAAGVGCVDISSVSTLCSDGVDVWVIVCNPTCEGWKQCGPDPSSNESRIALVEHAKLERGSDDEWLARLTWLGDLEAPGLTPEEAVEAVAFQMIDAVGDDRELGERVLDYMGVRRLC